MVVLTAETCWAMNEYWINNKISGIKLVFSLYASGIKLVFSLYSTERRNHGQKQQLMYLIHFSCCLHCWVSNFFEKPDITYALTIHILFELDDTNTTYPWIKKILPFGLLRFYYSYWFRIRKPVTPFWRLSSNCYINMPSQPGLTTHSTVHFWGMLPNVQ